MVELCHVLKAPRMGKMISWWCWMPIQPYLVYTHPLDSHALHINFNIQRRQLGESFITWQLMVLLCFKRFLCSSKLKWKVLSDASKWHREQQKHLCSLRLSEQCVNPYLERSPLENRGGFQPFCQCEPVFLLLQPKEGAKWRQSRCRFVMNRSEQTLALCISPEPGRWKKSRVVEVKVQEKCTWKWSIIFIIEQLLKNGVPTRLDLSWWIRRWQRSQLCVSSCSCAGKAELPWKGNQRQESWGLQGWGGMEVGKVPGWGLGITWFFYT